MALIWESSWLRLHWNRLCRHRPFCSSLGSLGYSYDIYNRNLWMALKFESQLCHTATEKPIQITKPLDNSKHQFWKSKLDELWGSKFIYLLCISALMSTSVTCRKIGFMEKQLSQFLDRSLLTFVLCALSVVCGKVGCVFLCIIYFLCKYCKFSKGRCA